VQNLAVTDARPHHISFHIDHIVDCCETKAAEPCCSLNVAEREQMYAHLSLQWLPKKPVHAFLTDTPWHSVRSIKLVILDIIALLL